MGATADISKLVELYRAAKSAEKGPLWSRDVEQASLLHGEACEAMWNEVENLANEFAGVLSKPPPARHEIERDIRRELMKRATANLSVAVSNMVGDLFREAP